MKRIVLFLVITLLSVCVCQSAFALPDDDGGLIVQNDTGELVVRLQLRLRELGFLNFKPTGAYRATTVAAMKQYQQIQTKPDGSAMIADGTVGQETRGLIFSPTAARNVITQGIPFGSTTLSDSSAPSGALMNWATVKEQLTVGNQYQITDFYSRKAFQVVYTGGEMHAEVECASPMDTAVYKELFGGEFNYSKRPVLIQLSGTLIAASLQGEPHGEDTVTANDMAGHACLFFDGSLSHVGSLPDTEHIRQVYIAAGRS